MGKKLGETERSVPVDRRIKELMKPPFSFERIGWKDFFRAPNGMLVAGFDSNGVGALYEDLLHSDYPESALAPYEVTRIHKTSEGLIIATDKRAIQIKNGNRNFLQNEDISRSLREEPTTSLEEQFIAAGFEEDPEEHHLYRGHGLVAFTTFGDNAKEVGLLRPIEPVLLTRYHFGKSGRIVGRGSIGSVNPISTYVFDTDLVTFNVGNGSVYAYYTKLKKELPMSAEDLASVSGILVPHPDISTPDFIVGGRNSTEVIRGMTMLNGSTEDTLVKRMRPLAEGEKNEPHKSAGGFIGETEQRLFPRLADDNELVVDTWGLTHQDIVLPFYYAIAMHDKGFGMFPMQGNWYQFGGPLSSGYQHSPYDPDEQVGHFDFTITNLDNGESIHVSTLTLDLIRKWGDYEGRESPWRMDPRKIVQVYPHLLNSAPSKRRGV